MNTTEPKKILERAKAFATEHLAVCSAELIELGRTGVLCDGQVRELARICVGLNPTHAGLDIAEDLVKRAALSAAASAVQPLVHRGFNFDEPPRRLNFPDLVRQIELAEHWEQANSEPADSRRPAPLPKLVPGCTARDAMVAATAIQWLGTDDGFVLLESALNAAGYLLTRKEESQ